jgi:hypothetical protein
VLERRKLMNEALKNIFGGGIVAFAVASVATRNLFVVAGVASVASVAARMLLVSRAYIRFERVVVKVVVKVVVDVVERSDHLW